MKQKHRAIFICLTILVLLLSIDGRTMSKVALDEHLPLRNFGGEFTEIALAPYWFAGAMFVNALSFCLLYSFSLKGRFRKVTQNFFYWSAHFFLGLASTGVAVMCLKVLAGRMRPVFVGHHIRALYFAPFDFRYEFSSFPSGHSQVIFCAATFFALLWPRTKYFWYLAALMIAATRVVVLRHFPSDVFAGMLIGVFGSASSVNFWSKWVKAPVSWSRAWGRVQPKAQSAVVPSL